MTIPDDAAQGNGMHSAMEGEWISLREVAELLGVHPSTVRAWADQGRLPVHRTQGGHRRFKRSDIELYRQSQRASETVEVARVVQSALRRTRLQITEGRLEAEAWYLKLDEEARLQYRQSGRALLQGLMGYMTSEGDAGRAEARALGYEYASRGHRCGLSNVEAVQAFLFFRSLLLEGMLTVYEDAQVNSARVWSDMFHKISAFTDQILVTLIETYAAYERNNR